MPYQWPFDPQELFVERYPQMVNMGLPAPDADAMRAAIRDMWADEPGGWVFEWSQLGARYAEEGNEALATLAYGWAKFPVLADEAKRKALQQQVEHYLLAAEGFPVDFERSFLELPNNGSATRIPVHFLAAPDLPENAPVLIASGGVDSWKMDLHALFVAFALNTRMRILAFDIPGTGECPIPLSGESVDLMDGLVAMHERGVTGRSRTSASRWGATSRPRPAWREAWMQRSCLAAPSSPPSPPAARFNSAWRTSSATPSDRAPPSEEEMAERREGMSLRPLLDKDTNSPMIVVNGADDIHVPQQDTLVFVGRRDTRVELLPDTGHCAISKLGDVAPLMIDWLNETLGTTRPAR